MKNKNIFFSKKFLKLDRNHLKKLSNIICFDLFGEKFFIKDGCSFEDRIFKDFNNVYMSICYLINLYIIFFLKNRKFFFDANFGNTFLIGITGSVSSGKSFTSCILKSLLNNFFLRNIKIEIISTDSFLYSNKILIKRGIFNYKGFPESYDYDSLINFVYGIKSGVKKSYVPIYSHESYDILDDKVHIINKPDILILEGLNIFHKTLNKNCDNFYLYDFIDFLIYIDASKKLLEQWYVNRFLNFLNSNSINKNSFFHKFLNMNREDIILIAKNVWKNVNQVNLEKNILPFKKYSTMIINKGVDHCINYIYLKI